jgi:hypothetical protein
MEREDTMRPKSWGKKGHGWFVVAAVEATACGGEGNAGFGSLGATDAAAEGGWDGASADGASSEGASFFAGDAELPPTNADCVPGTYTGQFTCSVMALGILKFPWSGSLSITLVGQQSGGGEFPVLTIAPDAKITGSDSNGGMITADLTGQLDCAARKLSGSMQNGAYTNGSALNLAFSGALTADYDAQTTPRAFANGVMGPLKSPQLPTVMGDCTWTAPLQ